LPGIPIARDDRPSHANHVMGTKSCKQNHANQVM
jgi:hypothetical protein